MLKLCSNFYFKNDIFQTSPKSCQCFGLLMKENLSPRSFKNMATRIIHCPAINANVQQTFLGPTQQNDGEVVVRHVPRRRATRSCRSAFLSL